MAKSTVKSTPKTLDIIKNDPWLKDYEAAIVGRHRHAEDKIAELTQMENALCRISLRDTYISACTARLWDGCSANGPMPPKSI